MRANDRLSCAPPPPLMLLLLLRRLSLLLLVTVLQPVPVTAQFRHMLFGPRHVPPPPPQCHCVHASVCPAHLAANPAAFCAGAGLVCCLARTATVGGRRSCGQPDQPDSGPAWTMAVTRRDLDGLLYRCAGALLSSTLVITVAHRVIQVPADELVVVANMRDLFEDLEQEVFRRVSAVIAHPKYYPGDQKHNLAILRLKTPLETGAVPALTPVCLPHRPAPVDLEGSCWASGWGRDVASHDSTAAPLVDVRVSFASRTECLATLAAHGQSIDLSSDLCLRTVHSKGDLCWLDPGSPVVCPAADGSATLVGLVSWARRCAGRRRAPMVVAAAIPPHLDWILAVLEA